MSTGSPQPSQITVDTTNETATLEFVDDRGNVTSPPQGASATFVSSDPNIATVAADPNNPFVANITPTNVGSVQVSVAVANAVTPTGSPIPNPDPVTLQVNPGAAVGERLTVGAVDTTQGPPQPPNDPNAPTPTPTDPNTPAPTDPNAPPAPGQPTTAAQPTQPTYVYGGDYNALDATAQAAWPVSGFQTDETPPRPLYYYSNDAPGSGQQAQANGNGADGGLWVAWAGNVVPVDQPTGG